MSRHRRCTPAILCLIIAAALGACGDDEPGQDRLELALREERAEVERMPAREAYRERAPGPAGSVAGTITVRGAVRRDTTISVHDVPQVCGERVTLPLVRGQRDAVADVVVWIDGIREGKPLPIERRFEARYARCRLDPYVQSALANGMLLLRSADPVEHRTRIIRATSGEALAVVRQGDAGSLIPIPEALRGPGLVELRSEPRPWARAWIRVFDHPYHAVTATNGAFAFDSVPPGRHRVVAWHPRLGRIATDVEVEQGEQVRVELAFQAEDGEPR